MARPSLNTKCVADAHAAPNERIAEFSSKNGGGLIALRDTSDGRLLVSVYRLESSVDVGISYDDTSKGYSVAETNPHSMLPWTIYDPQGREVAQVRSEQEARRFAGAVVPEVAQA